MEINKNTTLKYRKWVGSYLFHPSLGMSLARVGPRDDQSGADLFLQTHFEPFHTNNNGYPLFDALRFNFRYPTPLFPNPKPSFPLPYNTTHPQPSALLFSQVSTQLAPANVCPRNQHSTYAKPRRIHSANLILSLSLALSIPAPSLLHIC